MRVHFHAKHEKSRFDSEHCKKKTQYGKKNDVDEKKAQRFDKKN